MQRVTVESAGVQRLLTGCLLPPLIDIVVLLVAVCYLVALSWQMTVAALVLTPLALLVLKYAGRHVQAAVRRTMDADRAMGAELEQTISGIAEIQMFNAQSVRSKRFHEVSERCREEDASTAVWMQATANGSQVFIALSTVVVLLVGIGFSASFGLTFAGLMVFAGMVPTMFGAAQRVMGAYTTYQSVARRALRRPTSCSTPARRFRKRRTQSHSARCTATSCSRTWPSATRPEQMVLDGLSFSIKEGETVALVGGIGSGKSTVFNLLLRFLDPQRGRILLDGHEITEVTIASLRDQVSKLAQFPFFTKDTIRENIRLARQDGNRRRHRSGVRERQHPLRHHRPGEDAAAGTTRWWTCRSRPVGRSD